jgi:hypothetical protein
MMPVIPTCFEYYIFKHITMFTFKYVRYSYTMGNVWLTFFYVPAKETGCQAFLSWISGISTPGWLMYRPVGLPATPGVPSPLTLRAVVAGVLIGSLLCCSNMYFGLQTGWVTMGSLQVCCTPLCQRYWLIVTFSILAHILRSLVPSSPQREGQQQQQQKTPRMLEGLLGVFPHM